MAMGRAIFWAAAFLAAAANCAAAKPQVFIKARAAQPGEIMLVVVTGQEDGRAPSGSFGGAPLSFFRGKKGTFLSFAGIDLDVSTGPRRMVLELRDEAGAASAWDQELLVEQKEFNIQRIHVKQKFVTPKKDDNSRAEEEAKRLTDLFTGVTAERFFGESFQSPIPGATSARFGDRRVFNDVPKAPHSGADLRAAMGEPVHAPAGGKVVLTENLFYQGNTVILDHGYGLYSYYCHLSEYSVKVGDVVRPGAALGKVGATGRVTGPHLHWAVKSGGARVDPFSLIALDLSPWLGR